MLLRAGIIGFFCLLTGLGLYAQVAEGEELYIRDPAPRFHGTAVEQLQRFLLYSGCNIGPDGVDGWFGKDTEKALKEYQGKKGLPRTGRIIYGEFPVDLEWKSEIVPWEKNKPPSRAGNQQIVTDGTEKISGYFGTHKLEWNNEYDERYFDYILSPSRRYLVYHYYSPDMDTSAGMPIYVYDFLTQKKTLLYPFEAVFKMKLDEVLSGGTFEESYWTAKDELYLDARIVLSDGTKKNKAALFRTVD